MTSNGMSGKCCSAQSVCTGFPNDDFTVNSCIEILDAFNNSIDTVDPFGVRPSGTGGFQRVPRLAQQRRRRDSAAVITG